MRWEFLIIIIFFQKMKMEEGKTESIPLFYPATPKFSSAELNWLPFMQRRNTHGYFYLFMSLLHLYSPFSPSKESKAAYIILLLLSILSSQQQPCEVGWAESQWLIGLPWPSGGREPGGIARPTSYPGIIPGSFLFTQMTHRGSREQAGTIPPFSWDNPEV